MKIINLMNRKGYTLMVETFEHLWELDRKISFGLLAQPVEVEQDAWQSGLALTRLLIEFTLVHWDCEFLHYESDLNSKNHF